MTIIVRLDSDDRVCGARIGPYSQSDVIDGEIFVSDPTVYFNDINFCIYDRDNNKFIVDQLCEELRNHDLRPYTPPENNDGGYGPINIDYTEEEAAATVQEALDSKAKEYLYDSIISATSYINSTNPRFRADADAFVKWRDAVWVWAYAKLDDVKNNVIPKPDFGQLLNDMPSFIPPVYPE